MTVVTQKEFRVVVRFRARNGDELRAAEEHLRRRISQAIPERRLHTTAGYVVEMIDHNVSGR